MLKNNGQGDLRKEQPYHFFPLKKTSIMGSVDCLPNVFKHCSRLRNGIGSKSNSKTDKFNNPKPTPRPKRKPKPKPKPKA